jgi:hypothetical protein
LASTPATRNSASQASATFHQGGTSSITRRRHTTSTIAATRMIATTPTNTHSPRPEPAMIAASAQAIHALSMKFHTRPRRHLPSAKCPAPPPKSGAISAMARGLVFAFSVCCARSVNMRGMVTKSG